MAKDALIGYTGAADVKIPFCGSSTAGKTEGPTKSTIRLAGVKDPFTRKGK